MLASIFLITGFNFLVASVIVKRSGSIGYTAMVDNQDMNHDEEVVTSHSGSDQIRSWNNCCDVCLFMSWSEYLLCILILVRDLVIFRTGEYLYNLILTDIVPCEVRCMLLISKRIGNNKHVIIDYLDHIENSDTSYQIIGILKVTKFVIKS